MAPRVTLLAVLALATTPAAAPASGRLLVDVCPDSNSIHGTTLYSLRPDGGDRRVLHRFGRLPELPLPCPEERASWGPGRRFVLWGRGNGAAWSPLRPWREHEVVRTGQWPALSPDGRRVAYSAYRDDGDERLTIVRRDGSGARVLTDWHVGIYWPRWRPGGGAIAFWRWDAGPPGRTDTIWRVNADGSGLRALGPGMSPAWSPDGGRIVFSDRDNIWVMRADGSARRRVTSFGADAEVTTTTWSPDGRWLAFGGNRSEAERRYIWLVRPSGRDLHRLKLPSRLGHPRWVDWR